MDESGESKEENALKRAEKEFSDRVDHRLALARSPQVAALLADKEIAEACGRYERINNRSMFYEEGFGNLFKPRDGPRDNVNHPLTPLYQRVEKLKTEFDQAAMVEKDIVKAKLVAKLESLKVTDPKERDIMASVYFDIRADTEKTGYLYYDPASPTKRTVDIPEHTKRAMDIHRRFGNCFEALTIYANDTVVNAKQKPERADAAVELYCQCANAYHDTHANIVGEFPNIRRAQGRAEGTIALIQETPSLLADPQIKSDFLPALSILTSDIKSHNNSYLHKEDKPIDVKIGELLPSPEFKASPHSTAPTQEPSRK